MVRSSAGASPSRGCLGWCEARREPRPPRAPGWCDARREPRPPERTPSAVFVDESLTRPVSPGFAYPRAGRGARMHLRRPGEVAPGSVSRPLRDLSRGLGAIPSFRGASMISHLSVLVLAAALGQCPPSPAGWTRSRPMPTSCVRVRGIGAAKDDLLAMLKGMSPGLAARAEPALEQGVAAVEGPGRRVGGRRAGPLPAPGRGTRGARAAPVRDDREVDRLRGRPQGGRRRARAEHQADGRRL